METFLKVFVDEGNRIGDGMQVRVSDVKAEIELFNRLLLDYEQNYLNLYNEINKASFYWQDNKSFAFFEEMQHDKNKIIQSYHELENYKNIYVFLYEKYQKLGNSIVFDLSYEEKILQDILKLNDLNEKIYQEYQELDLSFCPLEADLLRAQMQRVRAIRTFLSELKKEVKETYQTIKNIENEVARKMHALEITYLKETDVSLFLGSEQK